IGDATIEESVNTIDYLTRRGGKISFSSNNVTLNGFGVMSTETPYKVDGLGLAFNSNDHIMGTSAKVDFLEKRMSLKGIYARGGEKKSGFGTWSETEGHKGDVAGVVLITDFFDELFVTEFEFDTTNHDIDTSDTVEEESDKAYRIKISGLSEVYDYEMSYSYTGPQFDVVGNQSIVKDWEGFDFISGLTTQSHRAQLLL
ncbi:MAG: hypothetical protein GY702_04055, partial [Desulfobulbaceae bacterium]|nr:hypothetical protein [Desulfobulbaceae bacterium]